MIAYTHTEVLLQFSSIKHLLPIGVEPIWICLEFHVIKLRRMEII